MFDVLVRRVYAGEELTAPVLQHELHLTPSAARHGLHILRKALRTLRPRPSSADVPGVKGVTWAEAREALAALESKRSTAVRQTLTAAGSRLAVMDYHALAREEISAFPELDLPPGSRQSHHGRVKLAVMHRLRTLLEELQDSETPTPTTGPAGSSPGVQPEDEEEPTALEQLEYELFHLGATPAKLEKIMVLARTAFTGEA
jgi:hypothetical protein